MSVENGSVVPTRLPPADGYVFLFDASSTLEQELLENWVLEHLPEDAPPAERIKLRPSRRRRRIRPRPESLIKGVLAGGHDPLLVPLRVVWLAPERDGLRAVRLRDLLRFGDPRDPDPVRQHSIYSRFPDLVQVVMGEPAAVSEVRERWNASGADQVSGLAEYITQQAALTLEVAERRLRGYRYKVPKLVIEQILSKPRFRAGIREIAQAEQRSVETVQRRAERYLAEIGASHSPYVIDLVAGLIRFLYTRGYAEINYSPEELAEVYERFGHHPMVFLPSHKSHFDRLTLQHILYENDRPLNHTAGGINLKFFPIGPLLRRTGVFFIRRSFRDNEIYKFTLRQYIAYLLEKRFPLEWYMEGGRSRSGKLRAPRYGMLTYVAEAYEMGVTDDVILVPVAIAYDQIHEIADHTREDKGEAKEKESLGWLVKTVRGLGNRYGSIYVRFGDPVSMLEEIGPSTHTGEAPEALEIQKLAFKVAVRINEATPITPTSMITLALLGSGRALTTTEITEYLAPYLTYIDERALPTTVELELDKPAEVEARLRLLTDNGVVKRSDEGAEPIYYIDPEDAHAAAYYRNTVIHFFLLPAIAELAALEAAEIDGDGTDVFWDQVLGIRDLLKFEFFFPTKKRFRQQIADELDRRAPRWREAVAKGGGQAAALATSLNPLVAHWVLRPFLEAYRVVADILADMEPNDTLDSDDISKKALGLGTQYHLQSRIKSPESISKTLFENALQLAKNRTSGLEGAELVTARRDLAREIRDVLLRIDAVEEAAVR